MFFNPLPGVRSDPLLYNSSIGVHPPGPRTDLQWNIGMVFPVTLVHRHQVKGILQAQYIQELEIKQRCVCVAKGFSDKIEIHKTTNCYSVKKKKT